MKYNEFANVITHAQMNRYVTALGNELSRNSNFALFPSSTLLYDKSTKTCSLSKRLLRKLIRLSLS